MQIEVLTKELQRIGSKVNPFLQKIDQLEQTLSNKELNWTKTLVEMQQKLVDVTK